MKNNDLDLPTANLPPLIDIIPAIVLRLVLNDNIFKAIYVNPQIQNLGYTVDDFMSGAYTWTDLIHSDDKASVFRLIQDYTDKKITAYHLHYRAMTKGGSYFSAKEYQIHHYDENGVSFCYDIFITLDNLAAHSLGEVDTHYRYQISFNDILVNSQNMSASKAIEFILKCAGETIGLSRVIFFEDNQDHTICKIVKKWCIPDIVPSMPFDYSIHYETKIPEIYHALRQTGLVLIHDGEIPEGSKELFEAGGIVGSALFAVYDEGKYCGFICFADCIIQRIWDDEITRFLKNCTNLVSKIVTQDSSNKKFIQSQRTYETVINNIQCYTFVTHKDENTILFANNAFKEVFGMDCVGKSIDNYLRIPNASSFPCKQTDIMGDPEIYCEQTQEWLALSSELLTWVDGKTACLTTCYDITAKKNFAKVLEEKIEERTAALKILAVEAQEATVRAENATNAKSQFLANMSHEIRTPMNAILGLSEILSTTDLTEKNLEHAKSIRLSSSALLNIINDILDISKLEANKLELSPIHYKLNQSIGQISTFLSGMAPSKNLECKITSHGDTNICLYGDDIRLKQILINLLNNSIKFTEKGIVKLDIYVKESHLHFVVSDNGIGISEESLKNIFDPFYQTDKIKNRNVQGTGLGLAICHNITKLMEGTISATSVYGEGTVFTLIIPKIFGCESSIEMTDTGQSSFTTVDAHVLVVDDMDINLYVAGALLESYGIHVVTAISGAEAIQRVQETNFDLVFMDHYMPEMDGIETTMAIRAIGNHFANLPIIALTANAMQENKEKCKQATMNDFLSKPIEQNMLRNILERWIPKKKRIYE